MDKEFYILVKELAREHYSAETYEHAKAVLLYTKNDTRYAFYSKEDKIFLSALALAHDLIEDTDLTLDDFIAMGFPHDFIIELEMLIHSSDVPYIDYIKSIVAYGGRPLIVKCADIKDHLMREDTLTKTLKTRYNKILPLLK